MTTPHVPKATLYAFPAGSVWSAPALLTAIEKKYTEAELEQRIVELPKGENFSPAFLRISPNGHVPVLVVPYSHTTDETISTKFKAISESSAITAFLDQASIRSSTHSAPSLSPATVQRSSTQKELIELVHDTKVDPNDLMLGFRDEAERKKGLEGLPGGFLKGRQAALERYAKEVGESDQRLAKWYKDKIAENGSLIAFYEGKADSTAFQKAAADRWAATAELVKVLESKFEPNTVYLVGDQISLADLHVGAWLARVLAVSGATTINDIPAAIKALEKNLPSGQTVGPKITALLEALFERESFKTIYADGFH